MSQIGPDREAPPRPRAVNGSLRTLGEGTEPALLEALASCRAHTGRLLLCALVLRATLRALSPLQERPAYLALGCQKMRERNCLASRI